MRLRYGKHCNDLRRGIRYATRVTSFAPGFDRVRDSSALIRRVYKAVIRDLGQSVLVFVHHAGLAGGCKAAGFRLPRRR